MSSPGPSSGTPKPADLFEDLWRQLRDSHQNALQELEAKMSKLKKERYLDAQRLEVFYTRNQQLTKQNKDLQDAITLLEERLRSEDCDRCAALEEDLKHNQDRNMSLIAKLKNERNSFEDENRKLRAELRELKICCSELRQTSSPEHEEGVIPDSPVLSSSLPVTNKLKKCRNTKDRMTHVRYVETPLLQSNKDFKCAIDAPKNPGSAEVLVPNTCEQDLSQISNCVNTNLQEAVAETCVLDLLDRPDMKTGTAADQHISSKPQWKNDVHVKLSYSSPSSTLSDSPDPPTQRPSSLLPCIKHFKEDRATNKAKRKKEESESEEAEEDRQGLHEGLDKQKKVRHKQADLINRTSTPLSSQSLRRDREDSKQVHSAQDGTSNHRMNVSCTSPAFKKPNVVREADKDEFWKKGSCLQNRNASHKGQAAGRTPKVDTMWSIDPALALSMYDSECRGEEDHQGHGELVDTDCTWVSHSLLQGQGGSAWGKRDSVSGEKTNHSLDMMFETTPHEVYKSYNTPHLGLSQPCDEDDDEEGEEEDDENQDPHERTASKSKEHNGQHPTFAHVAVVRKKDERRKLKGTTCKECETYYNHLPDEEKQKKLSACSRHRFLYIPPCTPENFWEVGFPSTQTCIERGYIKEEKNPQACTRRRQPYRALFSPKQKEQDS